VALTYPEISTTHGMQTVTQEMAEAGSGSGAILQDHPAQSSTTIDGWSSLLFGIPFVFIGLFIEASALNLFRAQGKHTPNWIIGLVGSFFFLAGASLVVHGLAGLIRRARYQREAALHPGQVWFADYHWRPEGFRFSAFKSMLGRLYFALFWSAFLVPFFWIGLRGVWPFLIGASLFALIGLYIWYRFLQMFADFVSYGNSFLQYDSFPYFLGGPLNARLRAPRHLSDIDELTLTLRCVTEKYVTTGYGNNRRSQVVCYQLYKDVVTISGDWLATFAGGDIPIQFVLPVDKPTTTLIATPPTYWEIEARGKARGADYQAYFLVPVYRAS
jgi:hypothetical protein